MKYNSYGTEYELSFVKSEYVTNGNLAIQIMGKENGEDYDMPFCMLTVNLDKKLPPNMSFIDSNNCPREIIAELEMKGKIIPTGLILSSGWCVYEAYEFTKEFLDEID